MNKKLITFLTAALIAAISVIPAAAAPTSSPTPSTSTVTSPDGTTRVVDEDGETVTPSPDTDDEDEEDNEDTYGETSETPAPESTPAPLADGITMEDPSLTPPDVEYAKSALLMDMHSGRVLYSKNLDERVYPASTTKIMTGILAIENANMEDTVSAPYEALKDITLEDSQMGILVGENLTVEQLIKSMLVYSANDSANVLAVHISGSLDKFVDLMNQKAQELGMTNTHFANTCGLHDDNHYTTARDLAILTKYAMKNETFRDIVKMPIYKIPATNKYTMERILVNTNLFLGTSRSKYHYYPPAIGVKTGHTSQSGYCLVSAAAYENMEFLAIVMGCPDEDVGEQAYSYIDSKTLFEYGFNHYRHQDIAKNGDVAADSKVYEAKNDMRVAVTVENDVSALIPAGDDSKDNIKTVIDLPDRIDAPVAKGDVLGTINYYYNDVPIGSSNLIATNDVARNQFLHVFHIIIRVITSPFFFVPVIMLIFILLYAKHKKKKRERQKRIQQIKKNRQQNETNSRTPDRRASRTERNQRDTKSENSRYSRDK